VLQVERLNSKSGSRENERKIQPQVCDREEGKGKKEKGFSSLFPS
jgi:hypothetical protein